MSSSQDIVMLDRADLESLVEKLLTKAHPRWLTVEMAASYASLSPESIRRLLTAGQLMAHRPRKGRVLIDREQLDNVISTATSTPRKGRGETQWNMKQE